MGTDDVRRHLMIHGHVQGVFFRDSTRGIADQVGATGWVRNNPDGTVEAEVQGAPDAVERVVEFCRHGPDQAVVQDCEVTTIPMVEEQEAFTVH